MDRHSVCSVFEAVGLAVLIGLTGCDSVVQPPARNPSARVRPASSAVDSSTSGTIRGRVIWKGAVPEVAAIDGWTNPVTENGPRRKMHRSNPNRPQVDAASHGVGNAVVFLASVDRSCARAWDHPPVRIVISDYQFHLRQGQSDSSYGFARQGDAVEMVSVDPTFHALHMGGAEFFTLMFPDPNQPLSRVLEKKGVVELTSAAGYTWMRGYLFVDDQPFYCRTDASGSYLLQKVPPGSYELVCWMPNWHEARHEREPETGLIYRLFFKEPVQLREKVRLGPKQDLERNFVVSAARFDRR